MARPAKLTEERMLALMAYADGEGDVASRAEILASLQHDPEGQAFVASLLDLSPFAAEAAAVEVPDLSGVTAAILAATAPATAVEKAPVVSAPAAIDFAAARRRKSGWGGILAGGLALAAAVALYAQVKSGAPVAINSANSAVLVASAAPSIAPLASAAPAEPSAIAANGPPAVVEVNRVDSDTPVDVFLIPAESTPGTSVVVWLGDDNALGGP
jgi:anti-sigma factor RsiW